MSTADRKRKMGRPKLPPELALSKVIALRVTEQEWADIERAASNLGMKTHEWARHHLTRAARRRDDQTR